MAGVQMIGSVEDFDAVCAKGKVVIVDFYADWCGPCKNISPEFAKYATQYSNILAVKVDVDELDDIASRFAVTAMPTFIVIKDGKKVEDMIGADKNKLKELFEKYN